MVKIISSDNNPEYKANDYYCGNIDGVIEKLDYIKSLGVNIIYFNPVFESPEYHRYSTANYMNIDPYFGTNKKFEELKLVFIDKFLYIGAPGVDLFELSDFYGGEVYLAFENLYDEITLKLLGPEDGRIFIKEFQEFISQEFYDGQEFTSNRW